MKKALCIVSILFLAGVIARAQAPSCPIGLVCISQAAANVAAQNARELAATKEKVTTLEAALVEKDKNVADVQAAAATNVADLKDRLQKTEIELATKTGQLIGSEAMNV